MKPESLEALVIDQSFGELPVEIGELLEAYLSQNSAAAAEAERLREAVGVTGQAVNRRPDIVRKNAELPGSKAIAVPFALWMRNASLAALAASICLIGVAVFNFKSEPPGSSEESGTSGLLLVNRESPWAKYRIENGTTETGGSLSVSVE